MQTTDTQTPAEALEAMLATAHDLGIHNIATLRALVFIREQERTVASAIAAHVGISGSAVTGTIDRLVAAGLVERAHDQEDRRQIFIALTPSGESTVRQILAA